MYVVVKWDFVRNSLFLLFGTFSSKINFISFIINNYKSNFCLTMAPFCSKENKLHYCPPFLILPTFLFHQPTFTGEKEKFLWHHLLQKIVNKQLKKSKYASKTDFGFTNKGSEMHSLRVITKRNFKFWFGSPCMAKRVCYSVANYA